MLLFLLVALAASEMCNTIPAGYSDTGCYLVAARAYCPELVARPAWYQEMRDRSLLDARISNIMSNPDATGTACCLRPLTGRNKGTSQVVCARTAAPTSKPRVRPPTGVAVPGDKLTGWPSECSGAGGLSLKKIQQLLGAGGVGPVKLGKGAYVQRTRTCTQLTGCLPWALAWSPRNSNIDWATKKPMTQTQPDLVLRVVNNAAQLTLEAPYVSDASRICTSNAVVYAPGTPTVGSGFVAKLGYYDANGGFGCRNNGFTTSGGNTQDTPVLGKLTNSCAAFFSKVETYTTASGYGETQWAFYTSF